MTDLEEYVARAMCAADGRNPDNNEPLPRMSEAEGTGVLRYGPAWYEYRRDAKLQIAAYGAIHSALMVR